MKDKETWEEANNYIYKVCTIYLIFSIGIIVLTNLMNLKLPSAVYYIAEILILFGPIVLTEIHLYKFRRRNNMF